MTVEWVILCSCWGFRFVIAFQIWDFKQFLRFKAISRVAVSTLSQIDFSRNHLNFSLLTQPGVRDYVYYVLPNLTGFDMLPLDVTTLLPYTSFLHAFVFVFFSFSPNVFIL
jgi:hypothetical protein